MTALAKTPGRVERYTQLSVHVPADAGDLATEQKRAEEFAISLAGTEIANADEYTTCDAMLSEVARRKAAIVEMRKSATGPLYEVIRRVEGWFRPLVSAFDSCECSLKSAMSDYRVEREREEREARELAALAAESGDAGALVEALTAATEAGAKPEARSSTRFLWRVSHCEKAAMSLEFLVPDVSRLEKIARAHKGDEPPQIPGVTFERTAQIGARK